MDKLKTLMPLWFLNLSVITATSINETLNLAEQIIKIVVLLLTGYFTYKIGKKKLAEKKDDSIKPL